MEIVKKHINMNYSVGKNINPEFVVIHETDNRNMGADAETHYRYWNSNATASTSVHYIVDDKRVIQLLNVNEKAWHVGDNRGYSSITNDNSIGIEICVNQDGDYEIAYHNCTGLVALVMKENNIPIENVVMHKDASGKECPRNIILIGSWQSFKQEVANKFKRLKLPKFNKKTKWIQILANQLKINDKEGKNLIEDGILGEKTIHVIRRLPILEKGCYAEAAVKHVQNLLNVKADGILDIIQKGQ